MSCGRCSPSHLSGLAFLAVLAARQELAAELPRGQREAPRDHALGREVRLPECHLNPQTVHEPAQREGEVLGIGIARELPRALPFTDNFRDQLALSAIEAEVVLAHRRIAPGPHPDLHPKRVVAEAAWPEARLLDQRHELR